MTLRYSAALSNECAHISEMIEEVICSWAIHRVLLESTKKQVDECKVRFRPCLRLEVIKPGNYSVVIGIEIK